jgi:hypothetical protein
MPTVALTLVRYLQSLHIGLIEWGWHDLRLSASSRMAAGGATDQTLWSLCTSSKSTASLDKVE